MFWIFFRNSILVQIFYKCICLSTSNSTQKSIYASIFSSSTNYPQWNKYSNRIAAPIQAQKNESPIPINKMQKFSPQNYPSHAFNELRIAVGRNDVEQLEELITTYGKECLHSTERNPHNLLWLARNSNSEVFQVILQNGMNPIQILWK